MTETEEKWEVLAEVSGGSQADILRGFLEAQGIPVVLNQEGAGRAYGIYVGLLGRVQILVPSSFIDDARLVLKDYSLGTSEEGGKEEENLASTS